MRICKDHPTQKSCKICKIIEPDGMWIEIYFGKKLVESVWITSEWDDFPFDRANSIVRKSKVDELLKFLE